jgi:hypothetical protein
MIEGEETRQVCCSGADVIGAGEKRPLKLHYHYVIDPSRYPFSNPSKLRLQAHHLLCNGVCSALCWSIGPDMRALLLQSTMREKLLQSTRARIGNSMNCKDKGKAGMSGIT